MDNNELLHHIEKRFDKLEDKLDKFSEITIENKHDVQWVKGYIKISLSALITLGAALTAALIRIFTGK